jgi:hypothetical protein
VAIRGRAKKQASMLAFIDPETLIPADHPLRTIKRFADAALLELAQALYVGQDADRGLDQPILAPSKSARIRIARETW